MDGIDRRILVALQRKGDLTISELAKQVNLSPAPCHRRIKRLEAIGIISGYRAVLDRQLAGMAITVLVEIKFDAHRSENTKKFQDAIKGIPEVLSCKMVSGVADYVLEIVVPSIEAYHVVLKEKLLTLSMIKDIQSNIVLETVKENAPIPMDRYATS